MASCRAAASPSLRAPARRLERCGGDNDRRECARAPGGSGGHGTSTRRERGGQRWPGRVELELGGHEGADTTEAACVAILDDESWRKRSRRCARARRT
jgi:hypothetical protein